jgi:hypothetical protein
MLVLKDWGDVEKLPFQYYNKCYNVNSLHTVEVHRIKELTTGNVNVLPRIYPAHFMSGARCCLHSG